MNLIGQWYVRPSPTLQVDFKEDSCAIRCPAQTAYANAQGAMTCAAGTAPRCQYALPQQPIADCLPVR